MVEEHCRVLAAVFLAMLFAWLPLLYAVGSIVASYYGYQQGGKAVVLLMFGYTVPLGALMYLVRRACVYDGDN